MKTRSMFQRGRVALSCAIAAVAVAFGAGQVSASSVTYNFGNITSNHAVNAATGNQYSLTVADEGVSGTGNSLVSFLIGNDGPAQSTIASIYFYDGALLGATMSLTGSHANVDFSPGASPGHLPGGSDYGLPNSTVAFSTSANNPAPHNGIVNTGQWLEITFELKSGKTYNDVVDSIESGMSGPFNSGTDLVVGIHVTNFENGGSESFVITPIPLPAPVWMGLAGLAGVVVLRRRRA